MSKNNSEKLDKLLEEAIANTHEDRMKAMECLTDIIKNMDTGDKHPIYGPIAVQYLGKMNKSTDQVIKLIDLLIKKEDLERKRDSSGSQKSPFDDIDID
jgi:hypothetical protein